MTITAATLWGVTQLGTGATALYTCPANGLSIVKRAVFTNVGGSPQAITVYVVRSGGTAGAANQIISAYPVSAGQAYVAVELGNLVLQGGVSVQALATTAASVNSVGSGFTQ